MPEKRKRGRPPLIPPDRAGIWRSLYGDIVHTDRQLQARWLATRALAVLGLQPINGNEFPAPTWLADWRGASRGKQGAIKWGVLEQLGRMSQAGFPDETIRDFAAALETANMSAKEAEARLRLVRIKPEVMRMATREAT
jgi:hypothetical protein